MSQICQGSFVTIPGTTTVNMPASFTPVYFEFEHGPRTGVKESHLIRSNGWQDMVNNRKASVSTYADATVRGTADTTAESITHYNNQGGIFTQRIGGHVSATAPGTFDVTATKADSAYLTRYKAFGA